jgi:hypothetical protein
MIGSLQWWQWALTGLLFGFGFAAGTMVFNSLMTLFHK